MPEPAEVFTPAVETAWKVRRVDRAKSDRSRDRYLVVLANETESHPAREEWLIQSPPGLLLEMRTFPKGRGKSPIESLVVEWQAAGGIQVPTRSVRTMGDDTPPVVIETTWRRPLVNGTLPPDWFPAQP
jgi:hypothetical protein